MFGTTQLFVFCHPDQVKKAPGTFAEVSFELAQEEIQSKAGYSVDNDDQTMETAILNKDLMEVYPGIVEGNAISDELERNTRFEILLVAPQILGKTADRTEVNVTDIFIVSQGYTHRILEFVANFLCHSRMLCSSLFC